MRIFSAKTFNWFTAVLSAIFFLSVCAATIVSIKEEGRIALEFEQMMDEIETFNYNQSLENYTGDEVTDGVTEEAMFSNGTEAFLYAYYNYTNAETFHVISRGTTINSVLGLNIRTQSKNIMIKYADGSASYELISYEEGNTYGRTCAKQIYYDKTTDRIYLRETTNIQNIDGDLVTAYSEAWIYDSVAFFIEEIGIMPGESIYDFSERAVIEEAYYKEVKVNGVVVEYQTQIISNPTLAGKPFARIANYIGNAVQMPVITQMKENAIISASGVLKGFTLNDKFEVKTKIPVIGVQNVKCESSASYQFITIGGEVLAPKPDVSNSYPR